MNVTFAQAHEIVVGSSSCAWAESLSLINEAECLKRAWTFNLTPPPPQNSIHLQKLSRLNTIDLSWLNFGNYFLIVCLYLSYSQVSLPSTSNFQPCFSQLRAPTSLKTKWKGVKGTVQWHTLSIGLSMAGNLGLKTFQLRN